MDDRIDMTDQFARDLRDVYVTRPSEATQARHLAEITELARARAERSRSKRAWRPLARTAKAAACAASLVLATAGLAVAGVDLPAPANDAFQKLGLSLPNQAGGDDGPSATSGRADDVHGVIDVWPPADRDCEFGHAVASAARGSDLPTQAQAACGDGDQGAAAKGKAHGQANGPGDGVGNSQSTAGRAFGEETSQEAQGLGDATPEQRRQFGEDFGGDTAEEAQDLGGGPSAAPLAAPAPPAAEGGAETGQTQSGAGQAMGDQASGGRKP
jgi:hypothetical protein